MPDDQKQDDQKDQAPDPAALAKENADLKARLAALEAGNKKTDDPDLVEKARRERESTDKDGARIKRLENSIAFNMKSPDFLKANASLLPPDVAEIFKQADKETYSDQTEKADAIKAGLIQSFFSVQANVDLLTTGQKDRLDEYLKLTKTGKQEKAQAVYDMIFEPAFERLKSEKRAKALNGGGGGSDADAAYREKIMKKSTAHYGIQERK